MSSSSQPLTPSQERAGRAAREAYLNVVGRIFNGERVPPWERLPETIRRGWAAAAAAQDPPKAKE